jgi:hypothetical protein
MMIDWSDDCKDADDSIRVKRELDWNVINENDVQDEKHCDPRNSTFLGIKIDWSDEGKNASDSIRVAREFETNVIEESE